METLLQEIRAYAAARGIKPATVLQYAVNLGGSTWDKWEQGGSECRMSTAQRIRDFMRDNPPSQQPPARGS